MSENKYAIFKSGAKQYKASVGDIVLVEHFGTEIGDNCAFNEVIACGNGADIKIGTPTVEGATVEWTVPRAVKQKKQIIFKHRQRKTYRNKTGLRQEMVEVLINSINA